MPNPKVGTVTMGIEQAVKDSKGGKVAYRVDKLANLHIPAGKLSFETPKLLDNLLSIIAAVLKDKPAPVKRHLHEKYYPYINNGTRN